MHNEYPAVKRLFKVVYKQNLQTGTKIILEKWARLFVTKNETCCIYSRSHTFGYVIQILLPQIVLVMCCHIQHLNCHLEVFFTKKTLLKCPLMVSKCLLSILERCLSFREFSCSKMTKKQQGPAPGELTVDEILWCDHSNETSSTVLLHGTRTCAIYFTNYMKFGMFWFFILMGV